MKQKLQVIINNALKNSYSYEEYLLLIKELVAQNKTTGPKQSEELLHYTKLNLKRMERLNKSFTLDEETKQFFDHIKGDYQWLVITEGWCGDASQLVPIFHAAVSAIDNGNIRFVLRDTHPELMDHFEVNGSRAIPILIALDKDTLEVVDTWGARPKEAQKIVEEYKKMDPKPPYEELSTDLQKWYNKDKGLSTQRELQALKVD